MTQLTAHFTSEELACPCCKVSGIVMEFVLKLELLRVTCGFPFKINSGYRCAIHNEKVGGVPNSPHKLGKAADIAIAGADMNVLVKNAVVAGFTGLGVKQHGPNDSRYIHLDTAHAQFTVWSYP